MNNLLLVMAYTRSALKLLRSASVRGSRQITEKYCQELSSSSLVFIRIYNERNMPESAGERDNLQVLDGI